ncbi:CRISPR-associated ring nuclease Csm6 [Desulfatibacillum aliphaticivorans]|uniref:CRISPR-associated ring nuclease Csm6 n=1 Tax=Desulfatibacillum aliphaticivorans TaxID=218208 RepID=UPI00041005B3|nr:CRISPR-associated ring nuclease Csm6 [Desulfatibacillum aliphaticivorans]
MKNILLAVVGLSPQVVTEALYALHQQQKEVHAIHIITTRDGKEQVYANLLGGENSAYQKYLRDYEIDPASIEFTHHNVHVIHDSVGNEIPDIIDGEDNELLLRLCMDKAFHLTKDPESAVFFSVAGGRKTMSSCLALAAQMYGRPQDRLYHVLVSPQFESNRDFYFPPKESALIEVRDKDNLPIHMETGRAQVSLIPLPFISVRDRLTPAHLIEPADPATLMLSLVKGGQQPVTVSLADKKIKYKGRECDLRPAHMALYFFLASQKKECRPEKKDASCKNCTDCFVEWDDIEDKHPEITNVYQKIAGTRPVGEMSKDGIMSISYENFNGYKSKANKQLISSFGEFAKKFLVIATDRSGDNIRYGIHLDKNLLRLEY